ncbi:MAG TPA: protein kinase, partial [Kofleriaceae bacterium]|nr:protein kinase [Kofleriaceae bacterium]
MEEQDDKRPTDVVDVPPIHDELMGSDVGGYVVDGELGRGGMGVVYSATHPVIGKRAAIKVLKPSLSNNPATVERFLQEARSVNQIGHPNIVDIFDFGALEDGRHYYLMDLLEGESLRARL